MNKLITILSLCFLLLAGCVTSQQPVSSQGLLGGIQPGPTGQLFPPHNNLPMNNFLFTTEGPATANNEPCTYGQTACKQEIVNNLYIVSSLPVGKPAGTQEVVTDWNGTAGTCVGGGSTITMAVSAGGSQWLCFGGSGGGGGGGPGQVQTVINGSGVSGGSGTMTCNEYWTTGFVKTGFCVGNAYYNPTSTAQIWTMPTGPATGIIPTLLANSTPFATVSLVTGNVVISLPFNMGATWTGVISTSEFY